MYHHDFEKQLLKLLYSNREFYNNFGSLIRPDYIDNQPLRILWKIIDETMAGIENLTLEFKDIMIRIDEYCIREGHSTEVYQLLKNVSKDVDITHIKSELLVQETVIKYVRRQEFKRALLLSTNILEQDGDYDQALKLINDAVSIGFGLDSGYQFENLVDFPQIYAKLYSPKKLIPTAFHTYDNCMMGGFAPGEIHVIQAPPKQGKSTMAINMAIGSMLHGKCVYHISLEISKDDVMAKYASRISATKIKDFVTCNIEDYNKKIKAFDKFKPQLFVNYWTEKTITVMTIRAWISQQMSKYDRRPDLIIIDYDDCLLPTDEVRSGDLYNEAGNIYSDMKRLADYFKCPILTFAQSQRGAWDKSKLAGLFDADTGENTSSKDVKSRIVEPILSHELAHSARKVHRCFSISSMNFYDTMIPDGYLYVDLVRRGISGRFIKINRNFEISMIKENMSKVTYDSN